MFSKNAYHDGKPSLDLLRTPIILHFHVLRVRFFGMLSSLSYFIALSINDLDILVSLQSLKLVI